MDKPAPIKLKSIKLNNIRRFGHDVEIKFGTGATILLAPNGSGKTAVLEAIELVLTSGVKRTGGRWAPLIRDGGQDASVQVSFGDWEREVAITKEGINVVNEGKLQTIFKDENPAEIPFLLRLTHLLDQRDTDWFCQQPSEGAGEQLAMLPLGRQASQVSSTVAKLRPSVARKITELGGVIETRQRQLESWNALLRVRDSAKTDLSKPLTPLPVLAEKLGTIFNAPELGGLHTVASIREHWAIANTSNKQNLRTIDTALRNLDRVVLVPGAYEEISNSLELLEQNLQATKGTQTNYQAQIKSIDDEIATAEANHRLLENNLSTQRTAQQRKQSHAKTTELLRNRLEQSTVQSQTLDRRHAAFEATQEAYRAALATNEVNIALSTLVGTIALQRDDLSAAKRSYGQWQSAVARKDAEEARRKEIDANLNVLAEELNLEKVELGQRELEHTSAKAIVTALQDASGAIRAAVSAIAEKLPLGSSSCPVCLENHGEQELRRRISLAVSAIDPRLNAAILDLRAAAEKLGVAQKNQIAKDTALTAAQAKQAQVNAEITNIEAEIQLLKGNKLLLGLALEEVPDQLHILQTKYDNDFGGLEARRATQQPSVDAAAMAELAERFASANRDVVETEETITRLDDEIAEAKRTIDELSPLIDLGVNDEQLAQSIGDLESEISLSTVATADAVNRKSALTKAFLDVDAQISRITNQLQLDRGRFQTQVSQWISAGLTSPPSLEQLENLKQGLLRDKDNYDLASAQFAEIETELARHAEANALAVAQQEVDKARGSTIENAYTALLAEKLESAIDEHAQGVRHKGALDEFHLHLTAEIEEIRDKVADVVPYWQAILRRIVQEPRFSGTNLSYYKKNTKDHASVQVGLGDGHVGVADVASQAQMTDLQLSFMLSMATAHQWSNWKAFLLDDPTQHHDLVHASSVFDVLRDFIAEHGFQVILTTHDSQQARFLMRKLSNDGIDAKLWTLSPSYDGMTAKQIGGLDAAETDELVVRMPRIDEVPPSDGR